MHGHAVSVHFATAGRDIEIIRKHWGEFTGAGMEGERLRPANRFAEEQTTALEAINRNIANINQVAKQTAMGAQQTAPASRWPG